MKSTCIRIITLLFMLALLASCASNNDKLARQEAARLKRQREIERAREEQRKLIAAREAREKEALKNTDSGLKEEKALLEKTDSFTVTSGKVTSVAISPDNTLIACGTDDGKLKVFKRILKCVKAH